MLRATAPVQIITLTREELYALVWSEPMTTVAARLRISDVGLKKRCVKHRIPVPGRGYWRKLETGKHAKQIALPTIAGTQEITFMVRPVTSDEVPVNPGVAAFAEYEAAHPIGVAGEPRHPHTVTRAVSRDLKAARVDDYGAIRTRGTDTFQIRIHPASADRVIRIVDALSNACEDRGFGFEAGREGDRYRGHLAVVIDGQKFFPAIDERMRQTPHRMTEAELERKRRGGYVYTRQYSYEPTGEFTLKLEEFGRSGLQTSWKNSRQRKVEARLNEVMIGLRALADARLDDRRRADDQKRRHAVIEQARAELRERIETEQKAVLQLGSDAAAWRQAENLRDYITAVEAKNIASGTPAEIGDWLVWARQQADRTDPLTPSPASILDRSERDWRPLSLWELRDE